MKITKIEEVIKLALTVPMADAMGLPLFIWGDPGIGKSAKVKAAAKSLGLDTVVVFTPTIVPDDLGPLVTISEGTTKNISPIPGVDSLFEKGEGVLFLDELSSARPAVQAASLGVVLDRVIAGKKLPNGVRVIAAGNPVESASAGWELDPPTANRFCHIQANPPTASEWAAWLLEEPIKNRKKDTVDLQKRWSPVWKEVRESVSTFILSNPNVLHSLPSSDNNQRSLGWPSPRTWEYVTRAVTTLKILDSPQWIQTAVIYGCIGEATGKLLIKHLKVTDIDTPKAILKDSKTWFNSVKGKTDVVHVGLAACVAHIKSDEVTEREILAFWELLDTLNDAALADVVRATISSLGTYIRSRGTENTDKLIAKAASKVLFQNHVDLKVT